MFFPFPFHSFSFSFFWYGFVVLTIVGTCGDVSGGPVEGWFAPLVVSGC